MAFSSHVAHLASIGILLFGVQPALAQPYPNKAIRILAPEAGGSADFLARVVAQGISGPLGQPVVVDNRGAVIASQLVATATPDGYTLNVAGNLFWLLPLMATKKPYDAIRDFAPITLATQAPNVLIVHPALPAKSVKELIALAKAKPGELNYASGPSGTAGHLAAELFNSMGGVKITRIPHKGTAPALNSVLSGEVQIMFIAGNSIIPHVKAGTVRMLAVTSAQPTALVPGLPTIAASGVPGYVSTAMTGLYAPAKTLPTIIKRLNEEIVRALNQPSVKEKLANAGVEVVGSSPEQFAAIIKSEIAKNSKVIKDAGINVD